MNADVLASLFDLVDLPTLCASSHVSRLWRDSARNHPAFWKTLSLDALHMSAADVVLFLDRIGTKRGPEATIRISLRCPTTTSSLNRLVIAAMVIPAVRNHMHRVEELALLISPAFAERIWPLFQIDAPRLRGLHIIVDGDASNLRPVPSLFNTSAHTSLERVFLRDLPLPERPLPLTHALKSLQAAYTIYEDSTASSLDRVLSWFPRSHTLDLRPIDRRYRGQIPRIPNLSVVQLNTVQHLVIRHERHLLGIPHNLIPILSIRAPVKVLGRIRQLLPETGMLALVFRVRMDSNLRYAMTGRAIVTTLDGTRIREFGRLKLGYLESPSFMEEIILSDRLVSLTLPLGLGFRTLCQHAYYLPQLQSLRLILNNLPDPVCDWCTKAVVCPMLSSLTFQREVEETNASISRPALEAFVRMALTMDAPGSLRIILEDIAFTGGESGMPVECRPARVRWDAVVPHRGAEPHWICQNPRSFGLETPHMEYGDDRR